MVKRYMAAYNDYYEAEDGEFVEYEDYERLKQEFMDYVVIKEKEIKRLNRDLEYWQRQEKGSW